MPPYRDLLLAIKTIDTPLKLLAFLVVVYAIIGGVLVPNSAELVQLTTIVSLGIVVALSMVVLHSKWDMSTTETDPILGDEHLPLHPGDVRVLRTGAWRCRWSARDVNEDINPYVDDTVTITNVDQTTGIIRGYGTSVDEAVEGYELQGRVSKKGYAHLYYLSGWPHDEKMGMVILQFDFRRQAADGWWLGSVRGANFPISGRVVWEKDKNIDGDWEDREYPFDYYEHALLSDQSEGPRLDQPDEPVD